MRSQLIATRLVHSSLANLRRSGWTKGGDSTDTALYFNRGNQEIDVLMNRNGGTFTLSGCLIADPFSLR